MASHFNWYIGALLYWKKKLIKAKKLCDANNIILTFFYNITLHKRVHVYVHENETRVHLHMYIV